jgi:uncharacterized protein GlcG (DUF336 family)
MRVTIEKAEVAIAASRRKAVELGTQMCIAVVDSGANLKAFHRMDVHLASFSSLTHHGRRHQDAPRRLSWR